MRRMGAGFAAGVTEALIIVTPFEVVTVRVADAVSELCLRL